MPLRTTFLLALILYTSLILGGIGGVAFSLRLTALVWRRAPNSVHSRFNYGAEKVKDLTKGIRSCVGSIEEEGTAPRSSRFVIK